MLPCKLLTPHSYRTCRMNEEKAIDRKAAGEAEQAARQGGSALDYSSSSSPPTMSKVPFRSRPRNSSDGSANHGAEAIARSEHGEPQFDVVTTVSYEESLHTRKGRRSSSTAQPWTREEDANLSRGYQKYGFQWTAIAKDGELGLAHRTGAQVRDRFRMKYPIVYQSSVPLPLPDAGQSITASRKASASRPSTRGSASGSSAGITSYSTMDPYYGTSLSALQQHPFTLRDPSTLRHSGASPPFIQVPPASYAVPSLSSQGSSPGTPATALSDRFSMLNAQPLPDPDRDSLATASASVSGSSEHGEHDGNDVPADPEEVRHLSILGLLNDVSGESRDDSDRLPSFKYALDGDWEPPSVDNGAGVILPPLMLGWDDLGGVKPMFELE